MLTPEQIKNLKTCDTLILEVFFVKKDGAYIKCSIKPPYGCAPRILTVLPHFLTLPTKHGTLVPTSKYDPCRKFKKGDKVRVVEWNGRHFHDRDYGVDIKTGCVAKIDESEKNEPKKCAVTVAYRQYLFTVPTCFLELVTPVEELEPYSVKETMSHDGWQIVRDGLPLAIYDSQRHPNAKAAAEAERDRLNAEYRKDQNND